MNTITVKALVEKLAVLPQDALVVVLDTNVKYEGMVSYVQTIPELPERVFLGADIDLIPHAF